MLKENLLQLLQQDIEDINGLINHEKYGLSEELMKTQTRAIHLKDHLEELIQ